MNENLDKNKTSKENIQFSCNNINTFLLHLIIIVIAYGMFLKMHYSIDSYALVYDTSGKQFLISGRIPTYFINLLFNKLNINLTLNQQMFSAYFIICVALSSTILSNTICKNFKKVIFNQWIAINIAIMIAFINVFFLEWFLFPESTFFFGTSILSTIIAIYIISEKNKLANIITSFILLMFAMGMYQANLGIFIIFSLTICLIKNKMNINKQAIKKSILILCIGFFNSILNVLSFKLIVNSGLIEGNRAPSLAIDIVKNNIIGILNAQKSIWYNSDKFLPKFSFLIFVIVIISILIYMLKKNGSLLKDNLYIISIILINYVIIFAPHLFVSSLWLAPRTIVAIFMFLSSMIILVIFNCINNRTIISILASISSIFLVINFIQVQNIGVNHMASNKLDKEYALMINREIEKYEIKNNIKVKNIASENDIQPTYNYNSIDYVAYDTNIRAFATSWADVNSINYFTGRNYVKVPMDTNIHDKYFKDKNWDYLDESEQFVFIGDTLYLILY